MYEKEWKSYVKITNTYSKKGRQKYLKEVSNIHRYNIFKKNEISSKKGWDNPKTFHTKKGLHNWLTEGLGNGVRQGPIGE